MNAELVGGPCRPWPASRKPWSGHDPFILMTRVSQGVAWIDDELGPDARSWAGAREGTRLVWARPTEGLTEEQAEGLLVWATS